MCIRDSFNLALHYAINKIHFRGHIFKRTRQLGAYADDIVLVARNKNVLKDTFIEIEREVSRIGLEVNEGKTKYMKVSAKENRELLDLHTGHYCFQGVTEFKYLGVILNNENRVSSEIVNRIITGNRASVSYTHLKVRTFLVIAHCILTGLLIMYTVHNYI